MTAERMKRPCFRTRNCTVYPGKPATSYTLAKLNRVVCWYERRYPHKAGTDEILRLAWDAWDAIQEAYLDEELAKKRLGTLSEVIEGLAMPDAQRKHARRLVEIGRQALCEISKALLEMRR